MTIEQSYLQTRRLMSLRRQTLRVAIDSVALMIFLGRFRPTRKERERWDSPECRTAIERAMAEGLAELETWSRKQGEDIREADVRGGHDGSTDR